MAYWETGHPYPFLGLWYHPQTGKHVISQNETLRDDWEAPENDVWDDFYAKQNA